MEHRGRMILEEKVRHGASIMYDSELLVRSASRQNGVCMRLVRSK